MKFILILITLVFLAAGGVGAYIYLSNQTVQTAKKEAAKPTQLTGTIQKVLEPGVEYTHLLKTKDSIVSLNSYTQKLDDFIGETVEVTGQYSGTTLYVDSIQKI